MSKIPTANKIVVALAIPIVIAIPFVVSGFRPPPWAKILLAAVTVAFFATAVILRLKGRKGPI